MISKFRYVCAMMLSTHFFRYFSTLYTGMITEIFSPICVAYLALFGI